MYIEEKNENPLTCHLSPCSATRDPVFESMSFSTTPEYLAPRLLLPLYKAAFCRGEDCKGDQRYLKDLLQHIDDSERIRLKMSTNGAPELLILGNLISSDFGRIYHLTGMFVDPTLQGRGLGRRFLSEELASCDADILAFHTQNKRMFSLGEKLTIRDDSLIAALAPVIGSTNITGTVDVGRYGADGLYGDSDARSELILPGLDADRGDARIFFGHIR